ncbi:MAG: hypothetical protein ABEN55_21055 [Bradymonadaceae bacterium]
MPTNPRIQDPERIPEDVLREFQQPPHGSIADVLGALESDRSPQVYDTLQAFEALEAKLESYIEGGYYQYLDSNQRRDIREGMQKLRSLLCEHGLDDETQSPFLNH